MEGNVKVNGHISVESITAWDIEAEHINAKGTIRGKKIYVMGIVAHTIAVTDIAAVDINAAYITARNIEAGFIICERLVQRRGDKLICQRIIDGRSSYRRMEIRR